MNRRIRLPRITDETLEQIIWGMENQDCDYQLDIRTWNIYSSEFSDDDVPSEYLVDLPSWTSSDGYQLMVGYVNVCADPALKRRLTEVLSSKSRGVFRRFRDVLSEDREVLDSWYSFKDSRMKAYVKSWIRENLGRLVPDKEVELEGEEPLELGNLLVEFEIRHLDCLDGYCRKALEQYVSDDPVKAKILSAFTGCEAFEVVSSDEVCAVLIYERLKADACILYYNVEEKHRDMGLFTLMFDMFNREMERHGVDNVVMPLCAENGFLKGTDLGDKMAYRSVPGAVSYSCRTWNENSYSSEFAYVL